MITINLFAKDFDLELEFPASWNELTGEEVVGVCKQQLLLSEDPSKMKAAIFLLILKARVSSSKKKMPADWVELLNLSDCSAHGIPLVEFLFTKNDLIVIAENCLLDKFYSPGNFNKISCGQFEDAEISFHKFYKNPDSKLLAELAAVLWLPKATDYINFIPNKNKYKTYESAPSALLLEQIEPWRLYAIFHWYNGSRQLLPLLFPVVHESEEEGTPDMLSFTKCIHAGAGPKNGSRDQIRSSNLYEFMFDMEQEAVKAKDLREVYESKS